MLDSHSRIYDTIVDLRVSFLYAAGNMPPVHLLGLLVTYLQIATELFFYKSRHLLGLQLQAFLSSKNKTLGLDIPRMVGRLLPRARLTV